MPTLLIFACTDGTDTLRGFVRVRLLAAAVGREVGRGRFCENRAGAGLVGQPLDDLHCVSKYSYVLSGDSPPTLSSSPGELNGRDTHSCT